MTFYKALDQDRSPMHGGWGRYPEAGEWTEHLDPTRLQPCRHGYHLVPLDWLLEWLGPTVWQAEPCGDHPPVESVGKVVTCSVRLTRRTAWDGTAARLFAADCAEMTLLGERACGREPDDRSWTAVQVARAYARGEATNAARDAAWAAAGNAAGDAVWDAAWDAAWAAAGNAAGDAVWAAARAARAAARAAAWAARDAAGAAAGAAAWDAAWDAAWAAAWERFTARLASYLDGSDPGPVTALYGAEVAS